MKSEDIVGIDAADAVRCSAKTGVGVPDVLERLVRDIPPPEGDADAPPQALIIDSGSITILAWFRWCVSKRHDAQRRQN